MLHFLQFWLQTYFMLEKDETILQNFLYYYFFAIARYNQNPRWTLNVSVKATNESSTYQVDWSAVIQVLHQSAFKIFMVATPCRSDSVKNLFSKAEIY